MTNNIKDYDLKRYEKLKQLEFEHVIFGVGLTGDCKFCNGKALLLVNWPAYNMTDCNNIDEDKLFIMCSRCAKIIDEFVDGKKHDSSLD